MVGFWLVLCCFGCHCGVVVWVGVAVLVLVWFAVWAMLVSTSLAVFGFVCWFCFGFGWLIDFGLVGRGS